MASYITLFVTLFAVVYQQTTAQLPFGRGFGLGGLFGNQNMMNQQQKSFRTCIGQTAAGDEMRVTFSSTNGRTNWWDSDALEIDAVVKSASIAGRFKLVATQYGRIDGMCESDNLGNIIRGQQQQPQPFSGFNFGWFNQAPVARTSIGEVGTAFDLAPGQSVKIQDNVNSQLNLDLISGGGMALCPVQQIVNNRCMDMISLCCAIAKDRQSATALPSGLGLNGMNAMSGQMNGMPGQMGQMNGMPGQMGQMNGMNSPMGQMSGMNSPMGQMNGMNGALGGPGAAGFQGRR